MFNLCKAKVLDEGQWTREASRRGQTKEEAEERGGEGWRGAEDGPGRDGGWEDDGSDRKAKRDQKRKRKLIVVDKLC